MKSKPGYLVLVLILIISYIINAQTVIQKHLTVNDGLVQSQVTCMLEDRGGNLWIGTFGGLSRWDGIHFENFHTQDGLPSQDVRCSFEIQDGTLLFGTNGGGLGIFDRGSFTILDTSDGLPDNTVRTICQNIHGQIIIGTDRGLCIWQKEIVDTMSIPKKLRGPLITSLSLSPAGDLYCGTYRDGIIIWRSDGKLEYINKATHDLPSNRIRAVMAAGDGKIFVAMIGSGIAVLNNKKKTLWNIENGLPVNSIRTFYQDREGDIYFATLGGGVALYNNGQLKFINKTHGLANNTVWSVYENKAGQIYFGSYEGISIYEKNRLTIYDNAVGLTQNIVTAIEQGQGEEIYMGTYGGGVNILKAESISALSGLGERNVWCISSIKKDELYIGCDSGLFLSTKDALRKLHDKNGLPQSDVYAIHQTRSSEIIIASYDGLFRLRSNVPELIYQDTNPRRSQIFSISETSNGDILLGTRSGILKWNNDKPDTVSVMQLLKEHHIWSILQIADGTTFFGSNSNGLFILENGQLDTLTTKNGLSNNTIYGIIEDDKNYIYLSTHKGINILERKNEIWHIRHLGFNEGLPSEECCQGAAFRDKDNSLWWGTIKGAVRYNPRRELSNSIVPQVHINHIWMFEQEISLPENGDKIEFNHNENYLKFNFIGIDLTAPHKVNYRYRLSGIDKNWVESSRRFVQYTNLPDGQYLFEVKAANQWGNWSKADGLKFIIQPPFWKTWWFILLAIAAISISISLLITYRVKQLMAIERLRTKIAADLHDDIGAGLTEISILGEIVTQVLPDKTDTDVSGMIEKISLRARELIDSMSDIVWLVNPHKESLFDLIARLNDVFETLLEANNIMFNPVNVEALKKVKLKMEHRHHLYLILKEAMLNSIKYSKCRKILLQVAVNIKSMQITLQDDGHGFDTNESHTGNGLRNMRERASILNGKFSIQSGKMQGTVIRINTKLTS
ncbi:MAG: hypothetical protein HND52_10310 [Ignavibacteriae bacterium]|nr:hypothetical protein [Ignavibacteriota bacterium]NOG98341.1 hypothetical protein [Ignavibacteriota bacterium]